MDEQSDGVSRRGVLSALGVGIGVPRTGRLQTAIAKLTEQNRTGTPPDAEIEITEEVQHLGDGYYGGTINSRFEKSGTQTSFTESFWLNSAQADAKRAELTFQARGVQENNPLKVNDTLVAFTPRSPEDGTASFENVSVDPSVLSEGQNTFTVESAYYGTGDYDDFEIFDVVLRLYGVEQRPTADFEISPADPVVGVETTFNARPSSDPDGRIETYEWDVDGDGAFEKQGEQVEHVYEDPGSYDVTLRVTDGDGLESTTTKTVQPVQVTASFEQPRLVQTIEESWVTDPDVSRTVSAPDLVSGRPTAPLFGLSGDYLDRIPQDAEPELRVSVASESVQLSPETVAGLESYDAAEAGRAFIDAEGRPPVFELGDEDSVRLELASPAFETNPSAELSAGSDFSVAEGQTLKIGMIEVRDALTNDDGERRFGDSNNQGRIRTGTFANSRKRFEAICDATKRYLERTYPVSDIQVVKSDFPGTYAAYADRGDIEQDLSGADAALRAEFDDLDATVAITPDDYFVYHATLLGGVSEDTLGIEVVTTGQKLDAAFDFLKKKWEQPPTATVARTLPYGGGQSGPARVARVVAQELGHHFAGFAAYPPEIARRGNVFGPDRSHARTENDNENKYALRSQSYDLFDGQFTYLMEGGTEGFWGAERYSPVQDQIASLGSFMSYSFDDCWADAHFYQQRIDGGFTATPPVVRESGSGKCLATSIKMTNDGAEFTDLVETTGNVTSERDGTVTVAIEDVNGNEIESQSTFDTIVMLGHGSGVSANEDRTTVTVPYPESTAQIRVTHEERDIEATVDPVSETLKGAIRRIPAHGFRADAASRRDRLLATATDFEDALDDNDFDSARSHLDDLESNATAWLRDDYETAVNEYSKSEFLALLEDQRSRVGTISADADDGFSTIALGALGAASVGSVGYILHRYRRHKQADDEESGPALREVSGIPDPSEAPGDGGPSTATEAKSPDGNDRVAASVERDGTTASRSVEAESAVEGTTDADGEPAGEEVTAGVYCPHCGAAVASSWQFCSECSGDLSALD